MRMINYIVSGLPRSGTSMLMQMLKAGGMPVATDEKREADENNPKGYLEIEGIIDRLRENPDLIFRYTGQAIKIIAYGLQYLPPGDYKIIYIERDIEEVLDSIEKMIGKKDTERDKTRKSFTRLNEKIKKEINSRGDIEVLMVNYNDVIQHPEENAKKIYEFIGIQSLDVDKMIYSVDKNLYRQRRVVQGKNE
ncbi:MAG: nucleotide pyrophosphatase [Thermoplasmata archaeon]|nr:MAG: nucleotide pyrophosphatase [Thermoplasmata archaeon]